MVFKEDKSRSLLKKYISRRIFHLYDLEIENDYNIKSIYSFIKKQLHVNKIIIEVSITYNDDLADINEYKKLGEEYNKEGKKINYISNDNYRYQVALMFMENSDFNLVFFKKIIKLYSGIKIYINLNQLCCDELLTTYMKKRKFKSDSIIIDSEEEDILIEIIDIMQYPDLKNDIDILLSNCNDIR